MNLLVEVSSGRLVNSLPTDISFGRQVAERERYQCSRRWDDHSSKRWQWDSTALEILCFTSPITYNLSEPV